MINDTTGQAEGRKTRRCKTGMELTAKNPLSHFTK